MKSDKIENIGIFGDSILEGIQINPVNKKYYIDNHIDTEMIMNKFSVKIKNYSSFGCTVTKGSRMLEKKLEKILDCDTVIMDYGGNDCDYNWKAISENPEGIHVPNTPLDIFHDTYCQLIDILKSKGIMPILTTLPPLEPQRFFNWFCKDLNQENIMKWLHDVKTIYFHQESYSREIEKIALEKEVPLVDLRSAFMQSGQVGQLLCEDGTHPNTFGQKIITNSFYEFAGARAGI